MSPQQYTCRSEARSAHDDSAPSETWSQLALHDKPMGVLNVNGYYDSLAAFLDEAVRERFLPAQHREVLIFEPDPETLLARMAGAPVPTSEKWLSEAET